MLLSVPIPFFATPTWSQVPGYANGGYKGLQRPPGRAVPVPANHHQPNNCPACLAAQEVPTAFTTGYLWVPRVPMGNPGLQHCGLLGTTAITRITMVTLAVVILVSFLLLTITDNGTTLFLQRRLTSTSPLSFLTCLTFSHLPLLVIT